MISLNTSLEELLRYADSIDRVDVGSEELRDVLRELVRRIDSFRADAILVARREATYEREIEVASLKVRTREAERTVQERANEIFIIKRRNSDLVRGFSIIVSRLSSLSADVGSLMANITEERTQD